jgi:dTDP-glucose 4,6-dehydratase
VTTILVTGGAGFIGSNYIRHVLAKGGARVINLDALTYAGNLENLAGFESRPDYAFVKGDVVEGRALAARLPDRPTDIVHFAAESHVDRSIEDPAAFLRTNVLGTQGMFDLGRHLGIRRLVHVSTDEVYGSLGPSDAPFTEEHPLRPNSPYAASKAASDLLARAAHRTHGFPVVLTRCSNNYGPYQFPEKLIPLMIANALEDQALPVYGDGLNVRDWIHVEDHVAAVELVREAGRPGETYNIGGNAERTNLEVVRAILELLGKPPELIRFVADRPGHDRRYAIDATRIARELGFAPRTGFSEGLRRTIQWYRENRGWWERVRSGAYASYYARMYGERLRGS